MKKTSTFNSKTKASNPTPERLKICLVCSAGGHLTEITHLEKCYSKYPHFFITFKRIDTIELSRHERVYFVDDTERNPKRFINCLIQSLRILIKERPDVVISTGAGVAIPACYLAKILLKSKIIFIESFCRIEEPSLSGRIMYPVADMFLVQWKSILKKYGKKAIYRGAIV